jgi:oligoribonuclease NrnB/cAMP/cGMP phosphodiesterase (DHH superfamily)
MKKVNIFFHKSDFDGHCSAAIANVYYIGNNYQVKLIPFNYGFSFPYKKIPKNETVVFVDISPTPYEEIIRINETYKNFLIIDHHKTFIEFVNQNNLQLKGKLEIGKAACELTWEYFFPKHKMLEAVRLIGRYDVWDKSDLKYWDDRIMPFHMGLLTWIGDVHNSSSSWNFLLNNKNKQVVANTIKDGRTILEYKKNEREQALRSYSFEAKFKGLRALCMNSTETNSGLFDSQWDENKYDIMLVFVFYGQNYKVSLYTTKDDIDVGAIAKQCGGGGHAKAAGFQTCELFNLFDKR